MKNYLSFRKVVSAFHTQSFLALSTACILLGSCSEKSLFVSNFSANTQNQPPAHVQKVSTLDVITPGTVIIAPSPVSVSGNWAKTIRTGTNSPNAGFNCNNLKMIGEGQFRFSAALFISGNSGLVTIDFLPDLPSGLSFLHIDFMQNNGLRLQDSQIIPGMRFPKDSIFIAQVTLKITSTEGTAHIALGGVGTAGTFDYNLNETELRLAKRFSKTELFIGYPWTGSFFATNIVTSQVK
ncbi:MAG: hypothetical protein ABI204_05895 [Ginsengibacter sp.]